MQTIRQQFCMLRAAVWNSLWPSASLDNCLTVDTFRRSLTTDLVGPRPSKQVQRAVVGQWYTPSGTAVAVLSSDAGLQNVTTYLLIYSEKLLISVKNRINSKDICRRLINRNVIFLIMLWSIGNVLSYSRHRLGHWTGTCLSSFLSV